MRTEVEGEEYCSNLISIENPDHILPIQAQEDVCRMIDVTTIRFDMLSGTS